jgi:hypothetical protein
VLLRPSFESASYSLSSIVPTVIVRPPLVALTPPLLVEAETLPSALVTVIPSVSSE